MKKKPAAKKTLEPTRTSLIVAAKIGTGRYRRAVEALGQAKLPITIEKKKKRTTGAES